MPERDVRDTSAVLALQNNDLKRRGGRVVDLLNRQAGLIHPDVRGEQAPMDDAVDSRPGSSPRPWGTRRLHSRSAARRRFIPTPVGNTGTQKEPKL